MMNGGKTELAEQAVVRRTARPTTMPTFTAIKNMEQNIQRIHLVELSLADPELVKE